MATFTLEEIGQRVSRLPPLADPVFDAALAFINGLGGIENLHQEHIFHAEGHTAPLADAINHLIDLQNTCDEWNTALSALRPAINTQAPPEYGL